MGILTDKRKIHISFDYNTNIEVFLPRIPFSTMNGEDATIKRICVADTVENCLTAHPTYWYDFIERINIDPYAVMDDMVYFENINESGVLVKVYEFDTTDIRTKSNEELIKEGLVPDASKTNESWILEKIKPIDYKYILIYDVENKKYMNLGKEIGAYINYMDYWVKQRK